ncbi:MAG: nitronate monooxygenase [Proteobacteria bacterium]|nr:nitronate monooxygenase [Pseudomonadota bacterium]MBU1386251.1 nitronate monooxygenase [Pseudomonadota bacterium]MBU1542944.1 nitronate monooxygenase [Pseudomonadota bacterium]MBU2429373.1 nitronate monooxygenase [Pseudomonadota bacterium]MBU2481605.1 nitronate monooxygenase [Pseudomonadota bacterium]
MIKTKMNELLGVKHPIIQAGMGPFCNNMLSIAAANAGVLGLMSTSGLHESTRTDQFKIYEHWARTVGADPRESKKDILMKAFQQANERTKATGGIFGINVMVSGMMMEHAELAVQTAIEAREQDPSLKDRFKVVFTSAGDPIPWAKPLKDAGFTWLHVIPSVKGALRCQKAGVDLIVASGHEGGFHTSWEPVHSMVLLPAVVEALKESGTPVAGAGGFCDGKSLVAALALGAAGVQMGTRFLATEESDFAPMWKQGIVEAGDRGTLVARGFVGPARWIKTDTSKVHQKNTLEYTPELFLDSPGPLTEGAMKLMEYERVAINAVYDGDKDKAMMAGGECAQRISDLPKVADMVNDIMKEAEAVIKNMPSLLK